MSAACVVPEIMSSLHGKSRLFIEANLPNSSGISRIPVYSPTQTTSYMRCPYLRQLKQDKWEANTPANPFDKGPGPRQIGHAVHHALEVYYRGLLLEGIQPHSKANVLVLAGNQLKLSGVDDKLCKLANKAVANAIEEGVQIPPEEVVYVEDELSGCRVDLVTNLPGYGFRVIDTKTMSLTIYDDEKLEAKFDQRMQEYEASWQLYHEAWAVRQATGVCPRDGAIQAVTLKPRVHTEVRTLIEFSDAKLDKWLADATLWWRAMEQDEGAKYQHGRDARRSFDGCFRYGICDFFNHCHRGAKLDGFFHKRSEEEKQ